MRWLFCNKVEMLMKKNCEKVKRIRDREMSGKMKRLKRKMKVQLITLNYFARPQPRALNLFMWWWWWSYKKYCCLWFQNLLWVYGMAWWVWDFPSWNLVPVRPCSLANQMRAHHSTNHNPPRAQHSRSSALHPFWAIWYIYNGSEALRPQSSMANDTAWFWAVPDERLASWSNRGDFWLATIVSRCQSFVWDSRKSCSVFRA